MTYLQQMTWGYVTVDLQLHTIANNMSNMLSNNNPLLFHP